MQPKMCSKCKKNIAVVFITKVENGVTMNEGYCLKCARSLGIPQIDQAVKQMGISEDDLDMLADEMSSMFGQRDNSDDADDDEIDSQTATFPLLNQLFGGNPNPPAQPQRPVKREEQPEEGKGKKKNKKHKFLDSYCMDLTGRARSGKLDKVIGRDVETERVIQILNRRQKNNPCLIGEPGVGKTAIAEGLAQRIASGNVPYKLRDKEVFLLDLTDTGLTGREVQEALDACGITLNKNCVPGDRRPPSQTSGVRIGTAAMTTKGYTAEDFCRVARRIDEVIRGMMAEKSAVQA